MDRAQRRRPTIAKDWQLAVLKRLQSESGNPSEEQRSAAAAETGLDEKWVKNWFIRQRSRLAARKRKSQLAVTEPHAHSAAVPTFKLQLCRPGVPSRRSASPLTDPAPHLPSPSSLESSSLRPPTADVQAILSSRRSVSAPMSLNNPSEKTTPVSCTTTLPTYSRDPLCNRYPDFSQFFRPEVRERFHTFQLSAPISDYGHLIQQANPDMASHAPMHIHSFFDLLNPYHLGGLSVEQSSLTNLQPRPIAFSMRLVDLLDYSSHTRYPDFPPS